MNPNRNIRRKSFFKGITFHHPSNGHLARETDHIGKTHFVEPFAVPMDFKFIRRSIQDDAGLLKICLRITIIIFRCQHRTRFILSGGITNPGGVIADDKNRLMPEVLELPELPQYDTVADV